MKDLLHDAVIFTSLKASDSNHFFQNVSQRIRKEFLSLSEVELRSHLYKQSKEMENFMPLQQSAFFCLKTKNIKEYKLVIVTTEDAISFDVNTSVDANLFFILLCPQVQGVEHLNILSRLTRLVRNEDFYHTLSGAETPDAMRSMLLSGTDKLLAA